VPACFHTALYPSRKSWNGVVSIYWPGYELGCPGFETWQGQNIYLYSKMSRPVLRYTQPPFQVPRALPPWVEQPGHEADHPYPRNAKVKYTWFYTSTPPICLHAVDRDTFTFTLYSNSTKTLTFSVRTVLSTLDYVYNLLTSDVNVLSESFRVGAGFELELPAYSVVISSICLLHWKTREAQN